MALFRMPDSGKLIACRRHLRFIMHESLVLRTPVSALFQPFHTIGSLQKYCILTGCKEVYDTCPQHIVFVSGFCCFIRIRWNKCTRLQTSPLTLHTRAAAPPARRPERYPPYRPWQALRLQIGYSTTGVRTGTNMNKTWYVTPFKPQTMLTECSPTQRLVSYFYKIVLKMA